MNRAITLFIYWDAARYDYITQENTPFLKELSGKGFLGQIQTVVGFRQEVAMMTGKYPNETGFFTHYKRVLDRSPFEWVRPFGFLSPLRRLRIYYPVKVAIRTISNWIAHQDYSDPGFVPINILPYFSNNSWELPDNLPTLTSLSRNSNHTYFDETMRVRAFFRSRRCRALFDSVFHSMDSGIPADLYLVHVGELDGLGHRYGPRIEAIRSHLMEMDSLIKHTFTYLRQKGYNVNLVVSSDHGMHDVKGTIDVENLLRGIPLRVPRDYVYFLDSTVARFWFPNKNARPRVERALAKIDNGHIVTEEEKQALHIDFRDTRSYGELLFWVDNGYMIFPNFFQSFAVKKTKGMHGYTSDNQGLLLVFSDVDDVRKLVGRRNVIPLVDVFNITRSLVGI